MGVNQGAPLSAPPPAATSSPTGWGNNQQGGGGGGQPGTMSGGQQAQGVAPTPVANAPRRAAGGTLMLDDSQGIITQHQEAVQRARDAARPQGAPAKPAGVLFWAAWVFLGLGIGTGVHFFLVHRAATAAVTASTKTTK